MSRLERYLEEREEQSPVEEKELQVEENPRLERLLQSYEGWLDRIKYCTTYQEKYSAALSAIPPREYSSADLYALSVSLKEYEQYPDFQSSGLFLSALVNRGSEEEYVLLTEHLEKGIDFLGYKNAKDLTVIGDAYWGFGRFMSGGTLTVHGNVGVGAGKFMTGGTITIKGNAATWVGWEMSGGTLIVEGDTGPYSGSAMSGGLLHIKGNAEFEAGNCMTGGVLRVDGNIEAISYLGDGEIYEGGKRVRPLEEPPWAV